MLRLALVLALLAPGCTTFLVCEELESSDLAPTHRQAAQVGVALVTIPFDLTVALPVNIGLAIFLLPHLPAS
jgi:hypothetical protein